MQSAYVMFWSLTWRECIVSDRLCRLVRIVRINDNVYGCVLYKLRSSMTPLKNHLIPYVSAVRRDGIVWSDELCMSITTIRKYLAWICMYVWYRWVFFCWYVPFSGVIGDLFRTQSDYFHSNLGIALYVWLLVLLRSVFINKQQRED